MLDGADAEIRHCSASLLAFILSRIGLAGYSAMDSRLSLLTQLVILLTAIVGLYKVSREQPKSGASGESAKRDPHSMWEFLKMYASIYAFILVPVAFMAVFQLLAHLPTMLQPNPLDRTTQSETLDVYHLSDSGRTAYAMALVALSVDDTTERHKLLDRTITAALNAGTPAVAEIAARAMETSERDDALLKVVRACIQAGPTADDTALSAVRDMQSYNKGRAATEIADALQRRMEQQKAKP